ncbi:hypothetical protein EK904_003302 [Melospiza melodia maxima]|nr:hypothetical protein EK904_003302 [Melospiza melodia maxima]
MCPSFQREGPLIPLNSPANSRPFPSGKASRWFGVSQSKSAKTSVNILQQEELIAQKKREIEARLEQQARQNSLSIPQLPLLGDDDGSESEASVSNKFVNDGSFLQQFLKLQREKSNAGSPNLGFPGALSPSFSPQKLPQIPPVILGTPQLPTKCPNKPGNAPAPQPGKKPPGLLGKRPGQALSRMLQARSLAQPRASPVLSRLSVFQGPDEDDEEDYEQWLEIKVLPPEDAETRQVVEKLARFVAEGGPELEKVAMEDYKDNPAFSFLHDKNSREFLYYRKKVAEIRKENQNSQAASSQKADQETRNSAEKLAQFVAAGGPEVEAIALQNNRENPAFRYREFLIFGAFFQGILRKFHGETPGNSWVEVLEQRDLRRSSLGELRELCPAEQQGEPCLQMWRYGNP